MAVPKNLICLLYRCVIAFKIKIGSSTLYQIDLLEWNICNPKNMWDYIIFKISIIRDKRVTTINSNKWFSLCAFGLFYKIVEWNLLVKHTFPVHQHHSISPFHAPEVQPQEWNYLPAKLHIILQFSDWSWEFRTWGTPDLQSSLKFRNWVNFFKKPCSSCLVLDSVHHSNLFFYNSLLPHDWQSVVIWNYN